MGIYLDNGSEDLATEVLRLFAVERAAPLRRRNDPRLELIVREAAAAYDAAVAAISIIERDQQVFVARTGAAPWVMARDASICTVTIQQPGEPLVVTDARADPRLAHRASVMGSPGIRFYAGVSVVDPAGYPLGALCVFDYAPRDGDVDTMRLSLLAREAERVLFRAA